MTAPHAKVLRRALTAYFLFPPDDERRRIIEYAQRRLGQPDIDQKDADLLVDHVLKPILRSVNA